MKNIELQDEEMAILATILIEKKNEFYKQYARLPLEKGDPSYSEYHLAQYGVIDKLFRYMKSSEMPTKSGVRYKLVSQATDRDLEIEVNRLLQEGWKLWGGLVVEGLLFQAMIREE